MRCEMRSPDVHARAPHMRFRRPGEPARRALVLHVAGPPLQLLHLNELVSSEAHLVSMHREPIEAVGFPACSPESQGTKSSEAVRTRRSRRFTKPPPSWRGSKG